MFSCALKATDLAEDCEGFGSIEHREIQWIYTGYNNGYIQIHTYIYNGYIHDIYIYIYIFAHIYIINMYVYIYIMNTGYIMGYIMRMIMVD